MTINKTAKALLPVALAGGTLWVLSRTAKAAPPQAAPSMAPPGQAPKSGMYRVVLRVYGADGSWLKDVVVKVLQNGQVLATLNLEELGTEVNLDMAPGPYTFQAWPDPSIDYYYGPAAMDVLVNRNLDLRLVLPRR